MGSAYPGLLCGPALILGAPAGRHLSGEVKASWFGDCSRLRSIPSGISFEIMPPRMRTRSAGRPAAESLGGGTGERVSRGGRGRRPREGNDERGCSYKEFLACNPKEYDDKGGGVALTHWIEKMESVHDMRGPSIDQKVKYTTGSVVSKALTCHEMQKLESELWNHAMVGAGHAAYTDRFHELARLVPHLVTPESRMIERYVYGLALQIRRMVKRALIFLSRLDQIIELFAG
ncbi:hypothetical protein Tco_0708297 [Tanacetum coccineum]